MKRTLKKYIAGLSLVLLVNIAIPCADGPDADAVRVKLYDPLTVQESGFTPFHFSVSRLNGYAYYNYEEELQPEENLAEWQHYLGGKVPQQHILSLVYYTPYTQLEQLAKGKITSSDSLYQNLMVRYIVEQKKKDLAWYLAYAKQNEQLLQPEDYWAMDDHIFNEVTMEAQIRFGQEQVEKLADPMLKQRYAYQVVVLLRYYQKHEKVIAYYDEHLASIPDEQASILKYWALVHKVYALRSLDKDREAQLNLARCFIGCHNKKTWCYLNANKQLLQKLSIEANNADRYAIQTLLAFKNPGKVLPTLKNLAAIDPNTSHFKALLIREINKIEDYILTRRLVKQEPTILEHTWLYRDGEMESESKISVNLKNDLKYLNRFIAFMEELSGNEQVKDQGGIHLMLGHLYYMQQNPKKALIHLNRASEYPLNSREQLQLHCVRILNHLQSVKTYDGAFAQRIWEDLSVLAADHKFTGEAVFGSLMLALQQAYHQQGQHAQAALFMTRSLTGFASTDSYKKAKKTELTYPPPTTTAYYGWYDVNRWWEFNDPFYYLDKYATPEQTKLFFDKCDNKQVSEMDRFLLNGYKFNRNRYLDLLGTLHLRMDQLNEALAYYQQIPPTFWGAYNKYGWRSHYMEYLSENPFEFHWNPGFFRTYTDSQYIDKRFFVDELLARKELLGKSPDKQERAKMAREIGNAYYNMSYHGLNWYYQAYGKKGDPTESVSWTQHNTSINQNYHDCRTAYKYYELSYKVSDDSYDRAEAISLMAAVKKKQGLSTKKLMKQLEKENPDYFSLFDGRCPGLYY